MERNLNELLIFLLKEAKSLPFLSFWRKAKHASSRFVSNEGLDKTIPESPALGEEGHTQGRAVPVPRGGDHLAEVSAHVNLECSDGRSGHD